MKHLRLSAITKVLQSGARPAGGASTTSGEIASLGAEHLDDTGGFRIEKIKRIPRSFFETLRSGKIKTNDILIVKDGATTGKTSFVAHDFPFTEAAVNERVFRLVIDQSLASPRYVFHFLRSPSGQEQIMTDFRGATVGGIGRTFIDGVQIPIFDASVQGRVVQILDRATNLIRLRQQALRQLTSLRVALFHSMFENEKSKSRQYDTVCLGDVCSLIRDGTHKTPRYVAAGVPFITVKNIVSGSLDFNKTKFVTHKEHLELTKRAKPEKVIF